ncbi:23567_t:CDS:2 [Gigaspora margarita]|uniref:23567_t:CDS:1 n=1 Tax=Gigaspora margarita TaxID=4874 RepID=A0ABM8W0Q3_GIGMA|nr:23567_t:CDS:2 [Gigaspora margarita]
MDIRKISGKMNPIQYFYSNTTQDDQHINIIVHEDKNQKNIHFGKITFSMSLTEMRKLLKNDKVFHVEENMVFLMSDIKTQIHPRAEESLKISDIAQDQCIHIYKNSTEPSLSQLVNDHHLLNGCYCNSDHMIRRARKKAFKFKNEIVAEIDKSCKRLEDDVKEFGERIEHTFVTNSDLKLNATIPLPWALASLKFGFNIESSGEKKQQIEKSYKYKIIDSVKCGIRILRDEVKPTKEFIDAIENTLEEHKTEIEKLNAIEALWEEFGLFCNEISTESNKRLVSASMQDFSLSYKSEKDSSMFMNENRNNYLVIDGDDTIKPGINDSKSQERWFETLHSYDKWKPINYSEVIWVYDLLDDKLRERLLKAFGQDVLLHGTDEVKFDNNDVKKSKIIEIKNVPPNMANNQIYATVYETNCEEVFSVHVVYYRVANPILVIKCIKTKKERESLSKVKFNYIVKVAWMIVGFRIDFNFKPSFKLKLKSCTEEVKQKKLPEEFKFPRDKLYCLLGTCAFRYYDEDDSDEDIESAIIAGLHFCRNKQN